ncbi:MAG: DUF262 domain-containing protein [Bacteroidales bacterium]|nr:DUF262 domain-containing protein [Bacteroidales bacterium]
MCNNTKAISFWNFLKENTIEIPIIQRDYAQGRLGKENLRKNFLVDLKNALDSSETMKLDFVYGSTEKDKLNPLDGQQRLTTLWLLHWYIALRAGKLNEDNCKVFRNFTYETRISSREFCQNLCVSNNFKDFEYKDIVGFITKQTWFYSTWKQDPTIQSILRMLSGTKDGIEGVLACHGTCLSEKKCQFENYWEKLSGENSPIIFYHLPLKDFGLSDDLYIKMNARGKQLTSFENFKADLIGYITKHAEDKSLNELEWKGLLDVKDGIPIKLDTDWTDIFWKKKSVGITDKESKKRKSNQIDEIFFVFMNRFFWNELFTAKNNDDNYILNIDKENESSIQENSYKYLNNSEYDNDTTIAYGGFDVYRYDNGEISLSFFQKLKRVLDNYFNYSKNNGLPECPWDKSFRFIPEYIEESGNNIEIENNAKVKILKVSTFNQVQRIVFFAVCKYFFHDKDITDNESSLKQWLRVVWNLVSGEDHNGLPEIRSTFVMRTAIKFIDSLDSHKVYESLRNFDINKLGNSSFDERCKKEIAKAIQILGENAEDLRKYTGACKKQDGSNYQTWEEIIIEAEKYAFFKGTIRFLFTDGEGNINWCDFDTKWSNAKKYFAENGIKDEYTTKAILLRSFISKFSKWGDFWGVNYDNEPSTWKLLLTSRFESAHCILTNTVNKNCDFSTYNASLKEFDNGFKELQNSVQKDLVKTTILVEASKWQSKLNWRYNTYCLYPFNNKAEKKCMLLEIKEIRYCHLCATKSK